jgi:predicted HAD superfamily hydrolase
MKSQLNANEQNILDVFTQSFASLKKEPLILYGLGEKTKLLLDNLKDFNFVALMDKNTAGCTVFSRPVISPNEVLGKTKYIIIVASYSSVRVIYQRIAELKKKGITVFYMNGEILDFECADSPILEYKETSTDLCDAISSHDIISFDIFDTLVCRKLLYPGDVFCIVERHLKESGKKLKNFAATRINAEKLAQNIDCYYNLDDIYAQIKIITGVNDSVLEDIKNIEIKTELDYICPRSKIVEAVKFAQFLGKQIVFTSDMYLGRDTINAIISKCGLSGDFVITVSCEIKKSKYSGTIFEYYREIYKQKKVLHIGDDGFSDIAQARKSAITTFKILSNMEMFDNSVAARLNISEISGETGISLDDRIILGHFAARCYNDPFALSNNKSRKIINNTNDIGYLFFGPLVTMYMVWLLKNTAQHHINKILFISRDGYILERLYAKINTQKVEGLYFYTSRRAAGVCSIQNRQDIIDVFNAYYMARKITLAQFLDASYGIQATDGDKLKSIADFSKTDLCDYIISVYEHEIMKNAFRERVEYEEYIKKLQIKKEEKIGVINLVGTGVTQFFFDKIFSENDIHFFYFLTTIDMKNIKINYEKAHALYGKFLSPFTCTVNSLIKHYLMAESVFSSPDEQFVKFENDEPVFREDFERRNFDQIKFCHQGIEDFFNDFLSIDNNGFSRSYNYILSDKIFGLLFDEKSFYVPDEVKRFFSITDAFSSSGPLEGLW